MSKIAFITGITGQDGSYLSDFLLEKGYDVYGMLRRTSKFNTTNIDHIRDRLHLKYGDLTDGAALSNYFTEIVEKYYNSDNLIYHIDRFEVYNLAAQSHVQISFEIPEYTTMVDGVGTLKLLEIIRSLPTSVREKIRFYQAGTSEMFGKVLEVPQKETTPFYPRSPYACAKVYSHFIVKNYREAYGIFAANGILFNHESPRRGENFVTMKIVNGVKDILSGKRESFELGNLDSKRDWGHAQDYIKGMWLILQQENPDDYVLATGETHTIRSFVEKTFAFKGKTITWHKGEKATDEVGKDEDGVVRVKINPKYFRPCEVDLLLGCPDKAIQKLGWKRKFDTLDKLIESMFS